MFTDTIGNNIWNYIPSYIPDEAEKPADLSERIIFNKPKKKENPEESLPKNKTKSKDKSSKSKGKSNQGALSFNEDEEEYGESF